MKYLGLPENDMRKEGFEYLGFVLKVKANQLWDAMPPWCTFYFGTNGSCSNKRVEVWVKDSVPNGLQVNWK